MYYLIPVAKKSIVLLIANCKLKTPSIPSNVNLISDCADIIESTATQSNDLQLSNEPMTGHILDPEVETGKRTETPPPAYETIEEPPPPYEESVRYLRNTIL